MVKMESSIRVVDQIRKQLSYLGPLEHQRSQAFREVPENLIAQNNIWKGQRNRSGRSRNEKLMQPWLTEAQLRSEETEL